jgi:hypothetical protein
MKKLLIYPYPFFLCFLFCCCQGESTGKLLSEAEEIIYRRPDSANVILDKISHPEQLTDIQQAELTPKPLRLLFPSFHLRERPL